MSLTQSPTASSAEEVLHGVTVPDPYRWLEDRGSPETTEWIARQAEIHNAYFNKIGGQDEIRRRVTEYLNTEIVDQPVRVGNRLFYRRRKKDCDQGSICVRENENQEERVLVDLTNMGPFVSVGIHCFSEDGSLMAYELRQGGAATVTINIIDTNSGKVFPESIAEGYIRGFAFTPDNGGYHYAWEAQSDINDHTIRHHRLGDLSEHDEIVFSAKRSSLSRLGFLSDGVHLGAFVVHHEDNVVAYELYLSSFQNNRDWKLAASTKGCQYHPFFMQGRIFVRTDDGSTTNKIIELVGENFESRIIIPPAKNNIRGLVHTHGKIHVMYIVDQTSIIQSWTLFGEYLSEITSTTGTYQLESRIATAARTFFYSYQSFTEPLILFEYDPETNLSTQFTMPAVPRIQACARTISYQSTDGTTIPMYVVSRADVDINSQSPTIMTGYGGFGTPMTPQFSVLVTIMLELGCVFALPLIRGGSEFGPAWHRAACGTHRQVAYDDFISAAAWLCLQQISTPERLAIFGGSNSGLLVGVAMTQRPDLFKAVLCIAPLLDMVRFERFDGAGKWHDEYGSVADPVEFQALYDYSPYHRVEDTLDYPAALFVSGDKDRRCNPVHVRKMAARLQDRSSQTHPIIVDYSEQRGHTAALPLFVRVEALTRRLAFLCDQLQVEIPSEDNHV